ncbi:glycine/betaine ABC transporter substrate-binding protein [Burkholderia pyrrocinia]|uniref:Glycine/betaine ABC transporter substrate-binding protein n=2 Tax=Burkholderia pyrrocinia TaxID=60550 RepID=A0A2Z5N6B6_BURPY|nr:glycine/betaine ABC transporter substrate-binding protein [Burkholderia pyrrocinia]
MAATGTFAHAAAPERPIQLTYFAEPDSEVVIKIARAVLEQRLGYKVNLVSASLGLQYEALAESKNDAMMMAWLPGTQAAYWQKYSTKLDDLGTIYSGKIGWVVPDYVPASEVRSISDLNKPSVKDKFNGTIQGIDPGAGLMRASTKAIQDYSLNGYNLRPASAVAMVAALSRAENQKSWIVVTGWSPHTMFAKWKLRYLEDPKGVMGGSEGVHVLTRKGFSQEFPRAAAFFRHYKISSEDLEKAMAKAEASKDYDGAVADYVASHSAEIGDWVKDAQAQPLQAQ